MFFLSLIYSSASLGDTKFLSAETSGAATGAGASSSSQRRDIDGHSRGSPGGDEEEEEGTNGRTARVSDAMAHGEGSPAFLKKHATGKERVLRLDHKMNLVVDGVPSVEDVCGSLFSFSSPTHNLVSLIGPRGGRLSSGPRKSKRTWSMASAWTFCGPCWMCSTSSTRPRC